MSQADSTRKLDDTTRGPAQWVYTSSILGIGRFRCPADHPAWRSENCSRSDPLIVFPRVPVRIRHADKSWVVADANCVMYYNRNQYYERALLDRRGDACEFFSLNAQILADIVSPYEPPAKDQPHAPFRHCSGPSESRTYLAQRRLFEYVMNTDEPDQLLVDETALELIRQVVSLAYDGRKARVKKERIGTDRSHRDAAEAAKEILGRNFHQRLSLHDIAEGVYLSPFHLCRIFRKNTGFSIHQYITQLRLRRSLELLSQRSTDLTSLALRLGFSSHAHFTSTFQKAFGVAPSGIRPGAGDLRAKFKRAGF